MRQAEMHIQARMHMHTGSQPDRQADRQTGRRMDRQADNTSSMRADFERFHEGNRMYRGYTQPLSP